MAARPDRVIEIFVVLAALCGLIWIFYQTRQTSTDPTTVADAMMASVNPLGDEVTPAQQSATTAAFGNAVAASGALDPVVQAAVVDSALTNPAGVSIFYQRPGVETSSF